MDNLDKNLGGLLGGLGIEAVDDLKKDNRTVKCAAFDWSSQESKCKLHDFNFTLSTDKSPNFDVTCKKEGE